MKLSTNTLIIGYPHISSDFLMVIKRGGFLQLGRPQKRLIALGISGPRMALPPDEHRGLLVRG